MTISGVLALLVYVSLFPPANLSPWQVHRPGPPRSQHRQGRRAIWQLGIGAVYWPQDVEFAIRTSRQALAEYQHLAALVLKGDLDKVLPQIVDGGRRLKLTVSDEVPQGLDD